MAKVAIITRTKDRPQFLRRAVESVADQTYTDYQHVIVNDGGDKAAVDDFVKSLDSDTQAKIKLFHRTKPSNAPDTIFNESIDRVDSEYVVIHDDDDTWHPEFLERTVAVLDKGAKGVLVRTENVYEEVVGDTITKKKTSPYLPDLKAVSLYGQCLDNQLTPIAFIYNRAAYVEAGKYDDSLPVVGDWEFGIRFLLKYDVDYLDTGFALAYYHRRLKADNSFKDHDHRTYITKVLNKYLRQDLQSGKLGIGYIMNDLRYEQDMMAAVVRKFMPRPVAKFIKRKVR